MSMWASLNRSVFKRTSTYALAVAFGAFFFERTYDLITRAIYENLNKGKLWPDVEEMYKRIAERKAEEAARKAAECAALGKVKKL